MKVYGIMHNLNMIAVHKVTEHSDRKDFKCDLCYYKGATAKYLRRHIDAVHESVLQG